MKKKIMFFLILIVTIVACTSCKKQVPSINDTNGGSNSSTSNQIQLLKTDAKLTQEQVLSRIKAEHLKENKGYIDSDEIITLITLPDVALIDTFNKTSSKYYESVAEYAESTQGKKQSQLILAKQDELIQELEDKGLIKSVEYQYTAIINAIAVKTTYGKFKKIGKMSSVASTIISDTYNLPKALDANDTSAVENLVDVYETGIFNSSSVDYTGEGTAVAVLDSGFDCSHTVFANLPNNPMLKENYITSVLDKTNAAKTTKGLKLTDVYYSRKIPFAYDYADKDSDVFPYDSEHGTHVAGIIGGKDDTITGVAINTQLVLLKVFPDLNDGAKTEDILAALEDAVLIGVDAINMSLGSSCGFSREKDGDAINAVYDKINLSGISLITAASNSYSSGFGGEQGNTSFVTNPDNGTVGSPSTYYASLSVASISGTKSKYILANESQVFFFKESNSITGKENDFFKELGIEEGQKMSLEYVTVPGVGLKVNYSNIDVKGKIALVRRGDNTFEEKAQNAKNAGAIGCIIYNNVEGDIAMSMGKSDHIPTIAISKDDGTILASKDSGTLTINYEYQAGPFMSDFSSWGPTPSLELKPEITAHGGNIKSSIPGGGYDNLSGTSMASPNLCGIVVLIRQYLKEKYPNLSTKEMSVLANQLLMSTANIVLNEDGNPYSPRKQGAGLASLFNAVNTKAYITVDGKDRTKLELFDDPKRTGVYTMEFNVVNLSEKAMTYDLSLVGMTESVSTSDSKHIAEKSYILDGKVEIELISGGTLSGKKVTVPGGETVKLKVVYELTNTDKNVIEDNFPYGMYVEGFVKLTADDKDEIDLNVPFLAFYGDWTQAPMFDKTYYEVESEAHNAAIDDEDKLKADYYATTPYGSYFYNYIIPLGTYLYTIDESKYDVIPASKDHIALSNTHGAIDGISAVYAGLLRNAKTMTFTIVDKVTGEEVYRHVDYNGNKAFSQGGNPIPYFEFLKLKSNDLGLVNNRQYEFKMSGLLDYGDGGVNTNVRNTFEFDFYLDDEAPIIKDVTYEKIYDKTLKKDRYYINMVVYDNQYVQSVAPVIFTSNKTYDFLTENPIPVYSEKGKDSKVRFEITDILEDIGADELITSSIGFSVDDYALNSNLYLCQLPGTKGDFKFTKDGTPEGPELVILSMEQGELVDLTQYLSTTDPTFDGNKEYLKHLNWISSNEDIIKVQDGEAIGLGTGRVTVTVRESMNGKQAVLIINVKEKAPKEKQLLSYSDLDNYQDASIKSIRFSYFDTLFAHAKAAQTSEIGKTGSRKFFSSVPNLSFYPGEKIKLTYDFDPWYAEDKYKLTYSSTNPSVATVDQDGVVTGLKKGSTNIVLKVEGSNLQARVKVTVKSEFVIENRTLIAYKGLGGDVVIPDDEGILYIGAYAFCLYETDQNIELGDDDFDANKIPGKNETLRSVVIPEGVEEIQKYAFYMCSGLEKVVLPSSIKNIREFAFTNNKALNDIDLRNVQVIGRNAFSGCTSLRNVTFNKIYAIGISAFEGCKNLQSIDLTTLRNTGERAFKDCTSLSNITLSENTKLSKAMFVNTGIRTIDIYEKVQIPEYCFAKCANLETVNIHNSIVQIGTGAFSDCYELTEFNMLANVKSIGEQAFYNSSKLTTITLPNNDVELGNYCFYKCSSLSTVVFQENTKIVKIDGSIFQDTNLSQFVVDSENANYRVSTSGNFLLSGDGRSLVFAATAIDYEELIIGEEIINDVRYIYGIDSIEDGAFCGANIKSIKIDRNLKIGNYVFANCSTLEKVEISPNVNVEIGNHAFNYASSLKEVINLNTVKKVGDYAFANTALTNVEIAENAEYGEGAFFRSYIEEVTIGKNAKFGLGAFQECLNLVTVNMPQEGGVEFGVACFAKDTNLANIDLSKVEMILEQAFYGCQSLRIVDLAMAKEIHSYAFADCSILSYVNLPVVEKIGEGAFGRYDEKGGAPQISEINLPETLTSLGDGAFLGCEGLLEVTLPNSLQEFGDYVFAFCVRLEKVVLPQSVKRIGKYAFSKCEALSEINLENIVEVDEFAFSQCAVLTNVNLNNVKTIATYAFAATSITGDFELDYLEKVGECAFQGTKITSFSAKNLTDIEAGAFQSNGLLTRFTFSNKLASISELAFDNCPQLEVFDYFKDGSKTIENGKINDYALIDNGSLYITLANGNLELKAVPAMLDIKTLVVLEGTVRIDEGAGNENKIITKIVLPDSLKIIGNYAFYGYSNLKEVEFKSVVAPALEDYYDERVKLSETDPGYGQLHEHFSLFGLEIYYFTFINLVGKEKPIKMVLPSNSDLSGYDSLVYEVYFGKVEDAQRSDYVAMEVNLIKFLEYAEKIAKLPTITLLSEELVNNAITAYNGLKQNVTDYGYSQEKFDELVKTVKEAKTVITKLKLNNASKKTKELQKVILELPTVFDISKLGILREVSETLRNIKFEERNLLDLTNYNALVSSYNDYVNQVGVEATPIVATFTNGFVFKGIALTSAIALASMAYIIIKRFNQWR